VFEEGGFGEVEGGWGVWVVWGVCWVRWMREVVYGGVSTRHVVLLPVRTVMW
jgi:hypothetical protein